MLINLHIAIGGGKRLDVYIMSPSKNKHSYQKCHTCVMETTANASGIGSDEPDQLDELLPVQ
jgi:hypothetical protein